MTSSTSESGNSLLFGPLPQALVHFVDTFDLPFDPKTIDRSTPSGTTLSHPSCRIFQKCAHRLGYCNARRFRYQLASFIVANKGREETSIGSDDRHAACHSLKRSDPVSLISWACDQQSQAPNKCRNVFCADVIGKNHPS